MIVDSLHPEISQLASCGRVNSGQLRGGAGTGSLSLLAANTGRRLRRGLVLGLILLRRVSVKRIEDGQDEAAL